MTTDINIYVGVMLFIQLVGLFCVWKIYKGNMFSAANFRRQYGILPVPEEVQDYRRENYAENVVKFPSRTKEQAYRTFILDYLDMETGIHPEINDYVSLRGRLMRKAKSLVDRW